MAISDLPGLGQDAQAACKPFKNGRPFETELNSYHNLLIRKMNKDDIFNIITEHSCEVVPELSTHSFQRDDQLSELGANSMDRADIIIMTLESLSLRIPLLAVAKAKNIGELTDLLYEQLQAN